MFFLAALKEDPDLKDSGITLGRLGSDLERRFSIHGEVAWYFTPWADFQRRTFNAITLRTPKLVRTLQLEHGGTERYTASRKAIMVVSPDPQIKQKLAEWQRDSQGEVVLVPVDAHNTSDTEIRASIARGLRERLGDRDLYQTQNPVVGDDFFGRSGLLRDITAAIQGDQNIAILGLRRSGKTSVLRELRRQLLTRRVVVSIADFQMLDEKSIDELAGSIASNLNEDLKRAKDAGIDVWIGTESERSTEHMTLTRLSDRIKRVASRNGGIRFVVAVDEVESAAAIAKVNPNAVRNLLGALRSAAQSRENVSLVFSGVANRMFQRSSLDDNNSVDNPMFGQVASVHLTSFKGEETAKLLRDLGGAMLLDWQEDAIDAAQAMTGGYPYFVRDLAAVVAAHARSLLPLDHDIDSDRVSISLDHVRQVADDWSHQAAVTWRGIVSALRNHHPAAADLLDQGLSETELSDWISADADAHQAADDLIALGLFERQQDKVVPTETLTALQALGGAPNTPALPMSAQDASVEEVSRLIASPESLTLEFKETSRIDIRTGEKAAFIEEAVVKTVAGFMNAEGGDLLIGVTDSGAVSGMDRDLAVFDGSLDRYERWLLMNLLAERIDKELVASSVRVRFITVRGKCVTRVTVSPVVGAAWVDNEIAYRRVGNQTVKVTGGREIAAFLARK
ncbi:RNA-binding domain-containing protein [Microbacterium sp. NPDC090014]|uniref:RNA-binding domain-containing protein n=1 Tax=Microbacterium sp. NPDC090014 TaxID=3364205 RepID=UPI00380F7FC3